MSGSTLAMNWQTVPLGTFAATTKNLDPSKFPNEDFELYSVPSYLDGTPELVTGHQIKSTKQMVEPGDVLLCKIVPHINRTWVVSENTGRRQIASGEWIVYRTKQVEARYLRYLLSAPDFREPFLQTVSGVGGSLMRARPAAVQLINIPIAPTSEQRRIVAKLDSLTARSSRARDELDCIPALIARYKQVVLTKAFSGELTADWRDANRATAPWSSTTVGQLLQGIVAGKNLRCKERPPSRDERGVVKVSAVTWGRFDPTQAKTLPEDFDPPSRTKIRKGDFLISRANTLEFVGAVVLVNVAPANLYLSDKILRLEMAAISKPWLLWFLRSPTGRTAIENGATGNQLSMRNLSQDTLRAIELPWPSEIERAEIVRRIESAHVWLDKIATEHSIAQHLLPKLDYAILAKAFRGELAPQDPNDEPASDLLKRLSEQHEAAGRTRRIAK